MYETVPRGPATLRGHRRPVRRGRHITLRAIVPTIPPDIHGELRLGTSPTQAAPVIHPTHACRWCGTFTCTDPSSHDRLFRSGETYARMSTAARNQCPACGNSVLDGLLCIPAADRCRA